MANHASSRKRIRQTKKRTARNKTIRTTVRTYMKRLRAALAAGDREAAEQALPETVRRIDMAVSKGIFHRNTGSRYISRMTQQVRKLAAA